MAFLASLAGAGGAAEGAAGAAASGPSLGVSTALPGATQAPSLLSNGFMQQSGLWGDTNSVAPQKANLGLDTNVAPSSQGSGGGIFGNIPSQVGKVDLGGVGQGLNYLTSLLGGDPNNPRTAGAAKQGGGMAQLPGFSSPTAPRNSIPQVDLTSYLKLLGGGQ